MEQTPPPPPTPQPTDHQPQPQPQSSPPSPPLPLPSSSSLPTTPSPSIPSPQNPNPNATPTSEHQSQAAPPPPPPQQQQQQQQPTAQNPQTRPPFNRTWQPPAPHFHHFSSPLPSASPSPSPLPPFSSPSPPPQRGGMAIGLPTSFSSLSTSPSFGQQQSHQFGSALGRGIASPSESLAASASMSQVRQPIQGVGGMGSLGSSSTMRPGGLPASHQQRPVQLSPRPQATPNNQSSAPQSFQGHSLLRAPSVGSPGLLSPSTLQNSQPHQPWLAPGSQGKPPLPSRPQINPQSLPQRSHIPLQNQHATPTSQQQQTSSSQQPRPPSLSHQPQEHYGSKFQPSRIQQSSPHQQQSTRTLGIGNQKSSSQAMLQTSAVLPVPSNRGASAETGESSNRILTKRSIQELVTQVDPSERLDPEVEDILVDFAEEFVDSITTYGCSLAKHRKSNTLEAKDILLHLERNWNMTLPGFGGDEIKSYKKTSASDIHRERLAVIKKSIVAAETTNMKSSAVQAAGNAKGNLAKVPANMIASPNPKVREAA
ncbi:hypothetical protein RJ639_035260 [Escallonia herrerae]|uniref:Transcription initiation factor TFIID subunit 12 domain-containing protein n=1 Tax=Escallonia herrerae TaxID=1293975 RepID=A0AA88WPG6_9ASTE|nr:hypothetical protein RJ639_035260 [Escallonia herrerae]